MPLTNLPDAKMVAMGLPGYQRKFGDEGHYKTACVSNARRVSLHRCASCQSGQKKNTKVPTLQLWSSEAIHSFNPLLLCKPASQSHLPDEKCSVCLSVSAAPLPPLFPLPFPIKHRTPLPPPPSPHLPSQTAKTPCKPFKPPSKTLKQGSKMVKNS